MPSHFSITTKWNVQKYNSTNSKRFLRPSMKAPSQAIQRSLSKGKHFSTPWIITQSISHIRCLCTDKAIYIYIYETFVKHKNNNIMRLWGYGIVKNSKTVSEMSNIFLFYRNRRGLYYHQLVLRWCFIDVKHNNSIESYIRGIFVFFLIRHKNRILVNILGRFFHQWIVI